MNEFFEHYAEFIPEFAAFQASLLRPLPTHLRINTLKTSPEHVIKSLEAKGLRLEFTLAGHSTLVLAHGTDTPGKLLEYFLGYVHPQAFTSCLASLVLNPKKGSYVLDMCAAPGGKTSHIAQLMDNSGLIIANELYPSRHVSLGHTLSRLGVINCAITAYQAQQFPMRTRFDYVLADVPCSGEGTFRKLHSRSQYKETKEKELLPELQKRILLRGYKLLKRGGTLLYSTCTYNPEENEAVVSHLLENSDAEIHPIGLDLPFDPGIDQWKGRRYEPRVRLAARFYPHRFNSVGFFMAKIGKPQ